MQFSLSSTAVMQEMLALTALRRADRLSPESHAPVITPDFAAGIAAAIRDAFSMMVMRLADVITAVDLDALDSTPDASSIETVVMRLTIPLSSDASAMATGSIATLLRRRLESTVAKLALAYVQPEPDAEHYQRLADESIDSIRGLLFPYDLSLLSNRKK